MELGGDGVQFALFGEFEAVFEFGEEGALTAETFAVADGEFGFLAFEHEGGEGLEVLWGDLCGWGGMQDLVVGC